MINGGNKDSCRHCKSELSMLSGSILNTFNCELQWTELIWTVYSFQSIEVAPDLFGGMARLVLEIKGKKIVLPKTFLCINKMVLLKNINEIVLFNK